MTIEQRSSHGVVILDVVGRMTVEISHEPSLAYTARDLLRQGRRHILINLEHVASIDSTGVRDIVEAYVTTTRQNGALKLLNLPGKVRSVLTVTRLLTVLETYDTEGDAVASFAPSTES